MNTKPTVTIFETKRLHNNWEQYTGHYCTAVAPDVIFDLPGRGGKTSRKAAEQIHQLWNEGCTAGQIALKTGCRFN